MTLEAENMNKTNVYKTGMWLGFLSDIVMISAAFFLTVYVFSMSVVGALPIYISSAIVLIFFLTMLDAYDDLCSYTTQKSRLPITLAVAFALTALVLALFYLIFSTRVWFAYRFCVVYLLFGYVFILAGREAVLLLLIQIRKMQSLLILYAPHCPEVFLNKLKRYDFRAFDAAFDYSSRV
jgi:FlaA1/EpsC-like NDP-sugar epimerase